MAGAALLACACAAVAPIGESAYDLRFRGVSVLYGARALARFRAAHVAIVGLGGVGSWTAEAIARTGFGAITLVDLDDVCISNTNRQLHSLHSTVGQLKVDVLAARIAEINPECDVRSVRGWVTAANADAFVRDAAPRYDLVIDAIDSVDDKCALIRACIALDVPIVTTGGAGGKRDPTRVRAVDITIVSNDPLMQQVRRQLREEGWPPEEKRTKPTPWGLVAVSSIEPPRGGLPGEGSCDRFGTATHLTGAFGFAAAAIAADILATDEAARRRGRFYATLRERIVPVPPSATEPLSPLAPLDGSLERSAVRPPVKAA